MIIWNKEKGLPEELTSWELKDEEASIWQAGSRESQAEGTREDKYFVSSRPGEQRPVWLRHSEHEGGDSQAVKKQIQVSWSQGRLRDVTPETYYPFS